MRSQNTKNNPNPICDFQLSLSIDNYEVALRLTFLTTTLCRYFLSWFRYAGLPHVMYQCEVSDPTFVSILY
jgi:hypothetical protein